MRRVDPPQFGVSDALDACLHHKDGDIKHRLEQVRGDLIAAEADYQGRGPTGALYEIEAADSVAELVSVDEMKALYTGTFSRDNTVSRKLYDKIKGAAPNGICPLCGAQQVKNLDHYLAKTLYAPLTITPLNLIPSCTDCNKAKLARELEMAIDQHLHPYFDEVDDERWLVANVLEDSPPSLKYSVSPPAHWPQLKSDRVRRHFDTLHHGALFASLSSDHLPSMRKRLRRLLGSQGADGVRAHLMEELEGHLEDRNNSWQIAMYAALHDSDWYCNGGFDA